MIKDCPNCQADRFLAGLHPQILSCWWCDYTVDYSIASLALPLIFEANYGLCARCAARICLQNLEERICANCEYQSQLEEARAEESYEYWKEY